MQQGAAALSDAELVAILLRHGRAGEDVMTLSRNLLERFGGLRGLGAAVVPELQKIKGLGPCKISTLTATGEIARRQLRESTKNKNVVRDPESLVLYLKRAMQDLPVEVFKVLFVNKANALIGDWDLFRGTVDEAAVYPREILKKALELHATGVILVHNHPSGRTEPSPEDAQITRKIKNVCEAVSIRMLDHLIIGGDGYFSFREQGMLEG